MAMRQTQSRPRDHVSPEQMRYARILGICMKSGLVALVLGFLAYISGLAPVSVPFHELVQLWGLPAPDYLRATQGASGWDWIKVPVRGEILPLFGIAILCGLSLVCVAALLPIYVARRDWTYATVVVLTAGVLALAASGVLTVA